MEKLIVVLIVLGFFAGAIAVVHRNHKREQAERRAARMAAPGARLPLDRATAVLAEAGLPLTPGLTQADLLDRGAQDPTTLFDLLAVYAVNGAPQACPRACSVNCESIRATGDYADIVRTLADGAGVTLDRVGDSIDLQTGRARLHYRIGALERHLSPRIRGNRICEDTLRQALRDLEAARPERQFWKLVSDDLVVLFCLPPDRAEALRDRVHRISRAA